MRGVWKQPCPSHICEADHLSLSLSPPLFLSLSVCVCTFFLRGRRLARVIMSPRSKDVVRVQRERVDPVSMAGQNSDQFATLRRSHHAGGQGRCQHARTREWVASSDEEGPREM